MVWMKYLTLLLALELAVTSCTSGNNNDLESRVEDAFVGRAFYSNLEQAGYAEPTTFSISADELTKGEPLTLSVNENYIYTYYYVTVDGQWQKQAFSQATSGNSNWIKSSASTSLDTSQLMEGSNYVAVYSCTKTSSDWNCHNNKWQIHQFEILPKSGKSKPVPLPPIDPQCGSDQECPYTYTCVENICIPPKDKIGLEWCDGKDNDGDYLVDEDQLGDKTFCDRKSLQSLAGYAFKHDQPYYVEAFQTQWNQEKAAWIATATTSAHCKIVGGKPVHSQEPYNLQRPMKALLTMYHATQDQKWLDEATTIADLMIEAAVPFDPNKIQVAESNQKAWNDWLVSLPSWNVDGQEVKLLYWDTSPCPDPYNPQSANSGYYRYMEAELQGLRGISELARILQPIDPQQSEKYYNYGAQVIGFYAMSFGGNPLPALDSAADKRAHFVMNAYDLYNVSKDQRYLDWAAAVSETLLSQETGTLTDLGDFVGIYWTVRSGPGEVDPYGVMDTSHANRIAELARYWHEEDSSVMAKSMLPKAVNTFLFKVWQSDPQAKIGNNLLYPTLFKNYPDGSNPCSDPYFPAYSPYSLGNVLFGWHELSRYDQRVLFTMESLTDALITGTYLNDFSETEACNGEVYAVSGNANPGMTINAIAEMALATKTP